MSDRVKFFLNARWKSLRRIMKVIKYVSVVKQEDGYNLDEYSGAWNFLRGFNTNLKRYMTCYYPGKIPSLIEIYLFTPSCFLL